MIKAITQTKLLLKLTELNSKDSTMLDFLTLDNVDFKDKIVLLRADINEPVDKDTKKSQNRSAQLNLSQQLKS